MSIHCIKSLTFRKNNDIKIKWEINGKINLYSRCPGCGFKKFETINKEKKVIYWKFTYSWTNFIILFEVQKKLDSKNPRVTKTKKGKLKLLQKGRVCDSKKIKIYQKTRSALLRNLGLQLY